MLHVLSLHAIYIAATVLTGFVHSHFPSIGFNQLIQFGLYTVGKDAYHKINHNHNDHNAPGLAARDGGGRGGCLPAMFIPEFQYLIPTSISCASPMVGKDGYHKK